MPKWIAFPHAGQYQFDAASATALWPRLHAGDAEPLPADPDVLRAWVLLHNGEFERAAEAGLQAGGAGVTAANKATCIYANYLEKTEKVRLDLFMEVAQRAERQIAEDGRNPSAWYWHAFALGRYSQGISVSRALAQGLGGKIKESLETNHPAAAPARRRTRRARRLPRGSDRQGWVADRRHDLWCQEGHRPAAVPGSAEDQSGLADRDDRIRQRPDDAGRRNERTRGDRACMNGPPPVTHWMRSNGSRSSWPAPSWSSRTPAAGATGSRGVSRRAPTRSRSDALHHGAT